MGVFVIAHCQASSLPSRVLHGKQLNANCYI